MSEHGPGNNPAKGESNNIDMFDISMSLEIAVDLNASKLSQFAQTGVGALPKAKGLNGMKMCEPKKKAKIAFYFGKVELAALEPVDEYGGC